MNAIIRVACMAATAVGIAYISLHVTVRVPLFVLLVLACCALGAFVFAFRQTPRVLMPGARTVDTAPPPPVEPFPAPVEPRPSWRFDDEEEPW